MRKNFSPLLIVEAEAAVAPQVQEVLLQVAALVLQALVLTQDQEAAHQEVEQGKSFVAMTNSNLFPLLSR